MILKGNRREPALKRTHAVLFPPGIALTPSAPPMPSARAPEKPDGNPPKRAFPKSETRAFPNFDRISPFPIPISFRESARKFRSRFLPFARFDLLSNAEIRCNIRSIRFNFVSIPNSETPKSPSFGLFSRLRLLLVSSHMRTSCMRCSLFYLLQTYFIAIKETN